MKVLTQDGDAIVKCDNNHDDVKKTNEIQDLLKNHEDNNGGDNTNESSIKRIQLPGISELLPCLYLCGAGATRPDAMEKLGVTCVINVASELPDTPLPDTKPLYLKISAMDRNDVELKEYFDEVADLIEEVRQTDGKTLIHCVAGVSRSASLCLAYFIKYIGMTLREAFLHVRSIRPQIRPNIGFFRQLIAYEEQTLGCTSVSMMFCEALAQEIPDVYEPEYRAMELFYQKHRRNFKRR